MRNSGVPGYGSRKLANINRKKKGKGLPIFFVVSAAAVGSLAYYFLSDDDQDDKKEEAVVEEQVVETTEVESPAETNTRTTTPVRTVVTPPVRTTVTPPVTTVVPTRPVEVPATSSRVYTAREKQTLTAYYNKAHNARKANDLIAARDAALKVIEMTDEDTPLWKEAVEILNDSNIKILTTDYNAPGEKILYSVRSGDNLDRIIKKYHTTIELVQKMNNMAKNSSSLRVGQVLKLYKGNWRIVVSKSRYRLYLYNGNKLFKIYNVGTGKNNKTPEGTFEIADKIAKPAWEYQGRKYPYGSAENVLGTRWMKIIPTGSTDRSYRGYGIHGTWEPNSIGTQSSNGCVRMRNNEVEELFSIIPKYRDTQGKRTPVTIQR